MANKIKWAVESGVTLMDSELQNAEDLDVVNADSDYDNATELNRWADFLFKATEWDDDPSAGAVVELHLFYKFDETNYADGEDGDHVNPNPTGNSWHGIFNIDTVNGVNYQQILRVPLSPFAFRASVVLKTGQDLTDVGTHFLKMYPYNEEVQ
jgi:hypothetical protein